MHGNGFIKLAAILGPLAFGLALGAFFDSTPAFSAEPSIQIPPPTAPPKMNTPRRVESFNCDRYFTHNNKTYPCDSDVSRDGEALRPIIQDVPAAVAALDTYQTKRRDLRQSAYVGSTGLLIAIAGGILSSRFGDSKVMVRNISLIGGLGLAAGSFVYSLGVLQTNEKNLGNAVNFYNAAHPETPIELQFSTGITF